MRGKLRNLDWYIVAGHKAGKSANEMARDFGVHHTAILYVLAKYGLSGILPQRNKAYGRKSPHQGRRFQTQTEKINAWMDDLERRGLIPGTPAGR